MAFGWGAVVLSLSLSQITQMYSGLIYQENVINFNCICNGQTRTLRPNGFIEIVRVFRPVTSTSTCNVLWFKSQFWLNDGAPLLKAKREA